MYSLRYIKFNRKSKRYSKCYNMLAGTLLLLFFKYDINNTKQYKENNVIKLWTY